MTTDFDESEHSPHYFVDLDRQYPELNLIVRMTQCDDMQAFVRAHKSVQWQAARRTRITPSLPMEKVS